MSTVLSTLDTSHLALGDMLGKMIVAGMDCQAVCVKLQEAFDHAESRIKKEYNTQFAKLRRREAIRRVELARTGIIKAEIDKKIHDEFQPLFLGLRSDMAMKTGRAKTMARAILDEAMERFRRLSA